MSSVEYSVRKHLNRIEAACKGFILKFSGCESNVHDFALIGLEDTVMALSMTHKG